MQMWVKFRPEEAAEFMSTIPLGRGGDCERDIGRAVVMLVGPDGGYITGSTLMLDGGQGFLG
jgi:meso-butanediol dehydrogenase/(S,S)-butanediol dehydrogenase/diacetyl reductase